MPVAYHAPACPRASAAPVPRSRPTFAGRQAQARPNLGNHATRHESTRLVPSPCQQYGPPLRVALQCATARNGRNRPGPAETSPGPPSRVGLDSVTRQASSTPLQAPAAFRSKAGCPNQRRTPASVSVTAASVSLTPASVEDHSSSPPDPSSASTAGRYPSHTRPMRHKGSVAKTRKSQEHNSVTESCVEPTNSGIRSTARAL